jgi:hypothetical protein
MPRFSEFDKEGRDSCRRLILQAAIASGDALRPAELEELIELLPAEYFLLCERKEIADEFRRSKPSPLEKLTDGAVLALAEAASENYDEEMEKSLKVLRLVNPAGWYRVYKLIERQTPSIAKRIGRPTSRKFLVPSWAKKRPAE